MKNISSFENPEIKKLVALKDKKGREKLKLFTVEGIRAIQTFLDAGIKPVNFFVTEKAFEEFEIPREIELTLLSEAIMKKISNASAPSGLLAVFKIPTLKREVLDRALVLYNIQDPGNLGTLIRTAAAFNVQCIMIDGCEPWNPKVIQSSAGTLAKAELAQLSWEDLLRRKGKRKLCALVVAGGKDPHAMDICDALLVVGSEAHGIPENIVKTCELKMTIPMPGSIESLNAAVAGSMAVYLRYQSCYK